MPGFSMLIVDDDSQTLHSLEQIFERKGLTVVAVESGESAVARFGGRERFDVCLMDIHLPGMNGIETLERIRSLAPDCAVVMMTAFASVDTAISALQLGASDYVIKPFEAHQIVLVVERIIERRRLLEDNLEFSRLARDRYDFSRIITVEVGVVTGAEFERGE